MSQPRRKSDRIAATPQASMAEEGGSSMFASKSEIFDQFTIINHKHTICEV